MPDVVMMTDETSAIGAPISGGEFAALESRAMHATIWTVISYGATQALRLGNSMILTRLLLPQAFGEMTLVMTLIIGMTMLSDIGLEPSVIQSPRGDEPEFLNTAWTLQAIRGGVLWAIAVLLAWALHWPSVWALVAGNLVSNLYKVVISHQPRCMPGIRNRFFWDRSCLTEIIHFGKWIFLATAFWFFALNSDKLILGKLVPLSVLGVYGIAFQLSDIPRQIINAFSIKVGYPFISRMVHLPMAEFRARFLRYRSYALMVGGVLLSLMVTWGGWAELKIYPARYADAHWMIPILAVGLWHTLLYQTLGPALLSLGKSKYGAFGNAAYCVTILIGIPTAFHFWGLLGAVIAVAAGDFPLYLVTAFGATREDVRPVRQDLLLTCGFLALLASEFALRHGLR